MKSLEGMVLGVPVAGPIAHVAVLIAVTKSLAEAEHVEVANVDKGATRPENETRVQNWLDVGWRIKHVVPHTSIRNGTIYLLALDRGI